MKEHHELSCHSAPSRRQALKAAACGFGSLAAAGLLSEGAAAEQAGPLAVKRPHHLPRAKRIIFIFMQGGPSQVDTFDHKPRLEKQNGQKLKFRVARTRQVSPETVMKSPWSFRQYGESGQWVSELFPHTAGIVDDLCFLHGMHTEGVAHGPSTLFLHTGATNLVRPSMGAWVSYGLGTENQNLPGFVTINPSMGNGGPRNYSNAFLPSHYQGTNIGRAGQPAADAKIRNITNPALSASEQQRRFAYFKSLNQAQLQAAGGNDQLEASLQAMELAYRMQMEAPGVTDLSQESQPTLESYGIGRQETDDFGRQCLLARRMAERGVRFIQVNYADNGDNPRWDQHSNLPKHAFHAKAVDQPVAALVQDLKQRGLLEDTLVWWGGEFGRNPFAQNNGTGRDHNPDGFTVWLAGGGTKAGLRYGETDEFGHTAVQGKVHMHDLHATVLHLLGLDHERLTYRYAGRDFRLTDVYGRVVQEIMS